MSNTPPSSWRRRRPLSLFFLTVALLAAFAGSLLITQPSDAAGSLTVSINAGYNLVVDSNVSSPSTYAPRVATVMGTFCNNGDAPLTNVQGFIGDYTGSGAALGTPGIYPSRDSISAAFIAEHPHLANSGSYSFTHVGGAAGLRDATRFMGTLDVGECNTQYWHFTYPACENGPGGVADEPPCEAGYDPVWGETRDANDDLHLDFDIWGTSAEGLNNNATWTMTMRNEISAMANKIRPNPDGAWFNTNTNTIVPGDVITSNGVLYELGNVNKGFDNDGDLAFDYNAWVQPVGDAGYDPSCFRLIRTSGVLTVAQSGGLPDLVIPFDDQLYFTNLPQSNTGVRGEVFYTFLALNGPCTTMLTPYQEVASGANNEKFNGDFGTGIPSLTSSAPTFSMDKTGTASVALGGTVTYNISFENTAASGGKSIGLPLNNMPLVISDTIPAGMSYVSGSATTISTVIPGGYTMRYSADGVTWHLTEAGAGGTGSIRYLQWWLNTALAPQDSGNVSFQATVPTGYPTATGNTYPIITNEACAQFDNGPCFDEDDAQTLVTGNNSIGDFVWQDLDRDGVQDGGAETGIANITVNLYYDADGDGVIDEGELLVASQSTNASGGYSFPALPDGRYIVQVDTQDTDLPTGYVATTAKKVAVDLDSARTNPAGVNVLTADFGFAPVLTLDKVLTSPSPTFDGALVTYSILLRNNVPGTGTGPTSQCTYLTSATAETASSAGQPGNKRFLNPGGTLPPSNLFMGSGEPNLTYSYADFIGGTNRFVEGTSFNLGTQPGTITKVEALFPVYLDAAVGDDTATAQLSYAGTSLGTAIYTPAQLNARVGASNSGYLTWDVTALRSWTIADFTGTNLVLRFDLTKVGSADASNLFLDALLFRVTTNQICGSLEETIDPLPLTDTFDNTRLQFVSTDQPGATVAGGTINWANVGPLYPGQTKEIKVTFKALNTAAQVTTNNTATVGAGSAFTTGRLTNNPTDAAAVTINPGFSIGDRVWWDLDGGRDQDAGEPGFQYVTVILERNTGGNSWVTEATQVTGVNGAYLFEGLNPANTYRVRVDTTTLPGGSAAWTNTFDVNGGGTGGNGDNISASYTGNTDITVADFGYDNAAPVIVGSIWNDWNNSATTSPDAGEYGLAGWTVTLTGPGCAPCTTTTDANGNYAFTSGLSNNAGYTVTVTPPAGWTGTWDTGEDTNPATALTTANSSTVTTSLSAVNRADFSYRGTVAVGDFVWRDWDGDGVQDAGEEGIAGVDVRVYQDVDGDGIIDVGVDTLVGTATTNASGIWGLTVGGGTASTAMSFIAVVDGADIPAGHVVTGDPDAVKNGTTTFTTQNGAVTRVGGTACSSCALNVDFGYQPTGTGSIGDFVWYDADGDGTQDNGEAGLPNLTVNLYEDTNGNGQIDAGDLLIATTTTDADGGYLFEDLPAGNFIVDVDEADADMPQAGGVPYTSTTTDLIAVTLTAGQAYDAADFGYVARGIIGDYIWQDNNGDGSPDYGEPGIAGVTVTLNGPDCAPCTTTTDADGYYRFVNLAPGTYTVSVGGGLPTGAVQTYDPDAVALPCTGLAECNSQSTVTLGVGQMDLARDFGFQPLGVLGDTVWYDLDGDGERDPDESGIAGVTINVSGPGCAPCTTTTDINGNYSFGGLADGTYTVSVGGGLPGTVTQNYDPDGSNDNSTTVTISGGVVTSVGGTACTECELDVDFGYQLNGSFTISGTVFYDDDNDGGLYNNGAGDLPYDGITVYLYDVSGPSPVYLGSTTTAPDGSYSFGNLPNGQYAVSVDSAASQLTGLERNTPITNPYYRPVAINNASVTQQDFGYFGALDFGDLPSTYDATLLGEEGARHVRPNTGAITLGNSVTTEGDGTESATSAGDTGDDGIVQNSPTSWMVGTNGGSIAVTVSGGNGFLAAWVDWNNDGDFDDPGEAILTDEPLSVGMQNVTFDIPTGTSLNNATYNTRFRLYSASTGGTAGPLGAVINGEVEDYQWSFAPTAVTLSLFAADSDGSRVAVRWETAAELDTLGFNLYRAEGNSEATLLTSELILAEGAGNGASYLYDDSAVQAGASYFYWLESVDLDGTTHRYGPVAATVTAPTAVTLTALTTAGSAATPWAALALAGTLLLAGIVLRRRTFR